MDPPSRRPVVNGRDPRMRARRRAAGPEPACRILRGRRTRPDARRPNRGASDTHLSVLVRRQSVVLIVAHAGNDPFELGRQLGVSSAMSLAWSAQARARSAVWVNSTPRSMPGPDVKGCPDQTAGPGPALTARRRSRQYRARCPAPSPTRSAAADRPVPPSARRQGLLALIIVIVAWGLTWPVNKVVLATLSPLWAVTLRSAIATVALFALTAWRGRVTLPPRQDLPVLLSITLLHMVGFNLLTSWGLGLVPTGRTVVLAYTTPLWVTPGAALFLREPLTARRAVGVLIGLAGLMTLFNPLALDWSDRTVVLGNLAILGGALLWALSILHIRAHRWVSTPFALIPWETLLATALLVPIALATTPPAPADWTPSFVVLLLYLGIVGTAIAYWATATASRHLPAVTTSLGLLATPVVSVITATLWLGEPLTLSLVIAIVLVLGGVAIGGTGSDRPAN